MGSWHPNHEPAATQSWLLAGYLFTELGITSCAVNTSATVGTTFAVTFTVFDYSIPSLNASVTRTISIIDPCDTGEYLCSDGTCSDVECSLRSVSALSCIHTTCTRYQSQYHSASRTLVSPEYVYANKASLHGSRKLNACLQRNRQPLCVMIVLRAALRLMCRDALSVGPPGLTFVSYGNSTSVTTGYAVAAAVPLVPCTAEDNTTVSVLLVPVLDFDRSTCT